MAYDFYFNQTLLPVPPDKLNLKVRNQNKTINLINGEEINLIKPIGLREYSFTILLPNAKYPFARYANGFEPAINYLDKFREFKTGNQPFQFIISRLTPDDKPIFDTNLRVSMEDYTVIEDAENGVDFNVNITLKECPYYGTKSGKINEDGTAILIEQRNADSAPNPQSYTVQSGDSLWSIAKIFLNDGERYTEIYDLNSDLIDAENGGNPKYTIHAGQVLRLPEV